MLKSIFWLFCWIEEKFFLFFFFFCRSFSSFSNIIKQLKTTFGEIHFTFHLSHTSLSSICIKSHRNQREHKIFNLCNLRKLLFTWEVKFIFTIGLFFGFEWKSRYVHIYHLLNIMNNDLDSNNWITRNMAFVIRMVVYWILETIYVICIHILFSVLFS